MKTEKAEKAENPQKKKRGPFTGVPGTLVPLQGLELDFSTKKLRVSPYDALLAELAAAPKENALLFNDLKARNSIGLRAEKKGMIVAFAEKDGMLYVRYMGRTDEQASGQRRGAVLRLLRQLGPITYIKLTNRLREEGDAIADAPMVECILQAACKTREALKQDRGMYKANPLWREK